MPRILTVDQVREGLPVLNSSESIEPVLYGTVRLLKGHPGHLVLGGGPDHVMVEWLGADFGWGLEGVGYGRIGPKLENYDLHVPESKEEWDEAVEKHQSTLIFVPQGQ